MGEARENISLRLPATRATPPPSRPESLLTVHQTLPIAPAPSVLALALVRPSTHAVFRPVRPPTLLAALNLQACLRAVLRRLQPAPLHHSLAPREAEPHRLSASPKHRALHISARPPDRYSAILGAFSSNTRCGRVSEASHLECLSFTVLRPSSLPAACAAELSPVHSLSISSRRLIWRSSRCMQRHSSQRHGH